MAALPVLNLRVCRLQQHLRQNQAGLFLAFRRQLWPDWLVRNWRSV
jgi:hypothetical protein